MDGPDSSAKQDSPQEMLAAQVLLVDDDLKMFSGLASLAAADDIHLTHAPTLQEALKLNQAFAYDLVLLKDRLPDGLVTEIISTMHNTVDSPELIVYTRTGDPNEAEYLLNNGCWDYLIDPSPGRSLLDLIHSAVHYRREKRTGQGECHRDFYKILRDEGVVGNSQELQRCLDMIPKAAQAEANVLITGESGTGKELFAAAIHRLSQRAAKKLVVVDCASLPRELVESILFGHKKGAFTGADKSHEGLVKQADGGTLFLDEIGELPMEVQKKFLRVLQERIFRPVGGNEEVTSNFRLIAATNKNLRAMCDENTFRDDLLFRLQTFHIELPPLRIRPADITELTYFYSERHSHFCKIKEKQFSPEFLMILQKYEWPGNVRELFNALEFAITTAQKSDTLYPMHLPTRIRVQVTRGILNSQPLTAQAAHSGETDEQDIALPKLQTYREKVIESTEQEYLRRLATISAGNVEQALKISGLSRSRLYNLLKKYDISLKNQKNNSC